MFVKAQLASLSASIIDNGSAILLEKLYVPKNICTMAGVMLGGIFHFNFSRKWVFSASEKSRHEQMFRYVLVWAGSFLLNYLGTRFLTEFTQMRYSVIKVSVSIMVGITYNYFLQKRFVFK